jgi:hypothetical protein
MACWARLTAGESTAATARAGEADAGWHAGGVSLGDDLERAAAAAAALGPVSAVLAAETASGERAYLVALGEEQGREWLVVDTGGAAVTDRERVREVASLVLLCELAVELAEADDPADALADGAEGEAGRQPDGDDVAAARAELARTLGTSPRIASAGYLDRLGEASRRLERVLGGIETPLASALAAHAPVVEAFVAEVESRHRLPLR